MSKQEEFISIPKSVYDALLLSSSRYMAIASNYGPKSQEEWEGLMNAAKYLSKEGDSNGSEKESNEKTS